MTIVISPQGDIHGLDEQLDRLKALVADIEALKSRREPEPAVIRASPLIRDWVLDSRPMPCLRGYIGGHPIVRSDRMAVTSDLWIWAPEQGYARTRSRWYQLGHVGSGFDARDR